MIKYPG